MSQPHTTLSKPEHDRTAQQWAWQFLRRNPEYVAAYELLSSLTQEQLNQLSCLVARCKGLLLSEDLLNESVIGTLDLRFFDDKYLEDLDDLGETVEEYRAKASEILGADEQLELIVSRRFWLETYCLCRWIDPVQNTELDAETAAGIWAVCVRRTHLESRAVIEDRPHEGDRGDDGTIDRWRAPAAARVQRRFQGVGSGTNP